MEYPSINSVFQRDEKGRFLPQYACPEFGYLADRPWGWTEKVDGTNMRLIVPAGEDNRLAAQANPHHWVRGRTDRAQIPPALLGACIALYQKLPVDMVFPAFDAEVILYGEGYGAGIQKGGQYRPDPSFVLFDVLVGEWWLERHNVEDVGSQLGLDVVPFVSDCTLNEAVERMREQARGGEVWLQSRWDGARPEGIVGRPAVDLWNRKGERITTKLKFKDFSHG